MARAIAFLDYVAVEVGVNEAIMLSNLAHWVEMNRASEKNFEDGKYWTYNTIKAYAEQFPFWSEKVIRNIFNRLEDGGYIESACYNKLKLDRTKWYTVTENGFALLGKCDLPQRANGFAPEGEAIPYNNTNNKPNNNTQTPKEYKAITERVVNYLNEKAGRKHRPATYLSIISARLKAGYTEEDLIKVIDNTYTSWKGTKYEQYVQPYTLFRDNKQVDKYLNLRVSCPVLTKESTNKVASNTSADRVRQMFNGMSKEEFYGEHYAGFKTLDEL